MIILSVKINILLFVVRVYTGFKQAKYRDSRNDLSVKGSSF